MTPDNKNPDITIRGGLIFTPNSTKPIHPPRHQPNTPRTKKVTTPRPDYQHPPAKTTTTATEQPPPTAEPAADPPPEPVGDPTE